jgi:cephalosporin-C deacetylase-like acetyl esterase
MLAQTPEAEKEIAVIELGGAVGHSLTAGESSFGGDIAVEVTPIEHWLELEAGVTPLFGHHSREWDTEPVRPLAPPIRIRW